MMYIVCVLLGFCLSNQNLTFYKIERSTNKKYFCGSNLKCDLEIFFETFFEGAILRE